jgi:phosphoglycolate phosphatase-like HAD superfamily hydrolase
MTKNDPSVRVLYLDFDGVIVESLDIKTDAFRELFQVYHAQIDEIMAYHLRNNGVSRLVKFKYIYEQILGLAYDDATSETVGRRFYEIVFQKVVDCPFVPGAESLLREFSTRLPIFVVSASPEEEVRRVVAARDLAPFFKGVYGAPGSKAEHIKRVLGQMRLPSSQGILVGDSLEDFEAARVAGVRFIGRRNQEEFDVPNIDTFADLIGVAGAVRELLVEVMKESDWNAT